jgi:branched-chain amino acid transport system permease protein
MPEGFSAIAVGGLGLGAIFALIAMSINIVYGASGVVNFAQGANLALAGFVAMALGVRAGGGLGWIAVMLASVMIVAALASAEGAITLWRQRLASHLYEEEESWLVTTVAVSLILASAVKMASGEQAAGAADALPSATGVGTSALGPNLVTVLAMALSFLAVRWFLTRTRTGLSIDAVSQDFVAARAAGLPARGLQVVAFLVSGLIVGAVGVIVAPPIAMSPDISARYFLYGFAAAVVGGLGSNLGAVIGGQLVGLATVFAARTTGAAYQDLVLLGLLVVVLVAWPQGLFGRAAARRA